MEVAQGQDKRQQHNANQQYAVEVKERLLP
jgi:hypothetical protein